jgi:hypothetical protein
MATEAQIAANRRNSRKSTGPRTEEGKKVSRLNALDHGCRASMLVLPSEDSGEFENKSRAWKLSLRPRNPVEEFLVEKLVSLAWQSDRIDQAHTARLTRRMYHGTFEEDHRIDEQVIELSQKLFRNASGPRALELQHKAGEPIEDGEALRTSDYNVDEDHPLRLVHCLQATGAGCEWLLGQWAKLRDLLEKGVPWLAPDKLKAVRLLGRHPIDAFDYSDVAGVYLASHTLLNRGGRAFQEILNELSPEEVTTYEDFLKLRQCEALAPKDAAAARKILLDIIEKAVAGLEDKADVYRELEEVHLRTAGHRLSWDDTPEGERLRRYELTCKRAWSKMFDLFLKTRQNKGELNFADVSAIDRYFPYQAIDTYDQPAPFVDNEAVPTEESVEEPVRTIEANSARENVPNEPNSSVQTPSKGRRDGHKEVRIDTPHVDRKADGGGITGKQKIHPAIQRLQTGHQPSLMNLSPIFGGQ